MRANLIHLDQLYSIPKYRIPGTPARVFPRKVKLPESSKFRPPIFGQTAKSNWELVLLRSILRAVSPDRLETSFAGPSYIYLEIPLTEFFCNLFVQSL